MALTNSDSMTVQGEEPNYFKPCSCQEEVDLAVIQITTMLGTENFNLEDPSHVYGFNRLAQNVNNFLDANREYEFDDAFIRKPFTSLRQVT